MDTDLQRLPKLRGEIELAVRLSRGWWSKIVRETGCRMGTLTRLDRDPDYDPTVSELAKLDAYFQVHGVRRRGSRADRSREAKQKREAEAAKRQLDAFTPAKSEAA